MADELCGTVLLGDRDRILRDYERWQAQPVDQEIPGGPGDGEGTGGQTTLVRSVSVTGPGTYFGRAHRTLSFEPASNGGWRFDRADLPDSLPIRVSVENVWTTVRSIVLHSGSPHNYMRMVEHIIALKLGLGLDHVRIRLESGDPPLFDRGSLDLVEGVERAGIAAGPEEAVFVTVRDPVTVGGSAGGFLTFLPAEPGSRRLSIDCALDFRSAIGKQRIRFDVNPRTFRRGAIARTNTTLLTMILCRTVGKIFADIRNLGYTRRNILVAGRRRYVNEPRLLHNGKSLEAAWHRAALDLLAALALIDKGRPAGRIVSYKSGHSLDVRLIRELYRRDLLQRIA